MTRANVTLFLQLQMTRMCVNFHPKTYNDKTQCDVATIISIDTIMSDVVPRISQDRLMCDFVPSSSNTESVK